jgi:DNA segregation ATPase FtsK/SpoIIIE-like protein
MKNNTNSIRILILEDDLKTVAVLNHRLAELEEELHGKGSDFSVVVLSEYSMVEQYINTLDVHQYHIVLLDRDCKAGGSFHTLEFNKFDLDKIISISSMPQWNKEAQDKGVSRVVWKDYQDLYEFTKKVIDEIRDILGVPKPKIYGDEHDPLYSEGVDAIQEQGQITTTFLQDELRIGYARAARLIDMLEDAGLISSAEGAEPRKVLNDEDDTPNIPEGN